MSYLTADERGEALADPFAVADQLAVIGRDLALRQNDLEAAALQWFRAKREREHDFAVEFMRALGTDAKRKAQATIATSHIGVEAEARWEALRAVVRVLETRASIGQSILRAQSHT